MEDRLSRLGDRNRYPPKYTVTKYRFSILSLFAVTAIVAAFFAGRLAPLERLRIAEQRAAEATTRLETTLNESQISIGGTYYAWNAMDSALTNGPEWINKSEPPPLGLMDVLNVCRNVAKTINSHSGTTKIDNWDLDSIALVPMPVEFPARGFEANQWAYCAEFQGIEKNGIAYERTSIIILMDETVLITDGPYADLLREHFEYLPNK
jgi:hypothetical protein